MHHTSTCNKHAFSVETSWLFFKDRKFLSQRSETTLVVLCQFGDRKSCVCTAVPDGVRSQETLTKTEISSPTIMTTRVVVSRSQWPRGLWGGSAAVHLLGLRIRIPLYAWMSVCCECCVLSGRVLCYGPISRPEESDRVCVCVFACPWVPLDAQITPHLRWLNRRVQT
jgi:hypothetical protein